MRKPISRERLAQLTSLHAQAKELIRRINKASASSTTVPDVIYHYTNLNGLSGIIDNKEIWASNVSFLNDRQELRHGIEICGKVLRQELKGVPEDDQKSKLINKALQTLVDIKLPETYAACFCATADLLSQWRGYGGSEQGVAIAFETDGLKSMFANAGAEIHPIVYGNNRSTPKISESLQMELSQINPEAMTSDGESGSPEAIDSLIKLITSLAPQFKDYGFREEREIRFVIQRSADYANPIHFRARGHLIVPYLKIKETSDRLPIKKLLVGPGHEQDVTIQSLRMYLKAKGYGEIEITPSSVPYRPN